MLVQGLSGLIGGAGLVLDPSGRLLRIPRHLLEGSPFADYTVPGWFLLTLLGLVPVVAFYGLVRGRVWSRLLSVLVGVALCLWIVVQIAVIGYQTDPPLQLLYGLLGLAILVLASHPATRRDLLEPPTEDEQSRRGRG